MKLISKIRDYLPRHEERFATLAAVEVMNDSGALITRATLRDISKIGGFIRLNRSQILPDNFVIWIPKLGRTVNGSIKWQSANEIGVRFDEEVDLQVFLVHRQNRAERVAKYFASTRAAA